MSTTPESAGAAAPPQETEKAPITAVVEYSKVAAALADLNARYGQVVFDVATRDGMRDAVKARGEVRGYRLDLETKRQELKGPVLERGRLIDAEAKRIEGELRKIEEPLDDLIKAEEKRKEEAKAEAERKERERVDSVQREISELASLPLQYSGRPAADIAAALSETREYELGPHLKEFEETMRSTKARAVAALKQLHAGAVAQEKARADEEARQQREREELARLRKAQEERDREAEQKAKEDSARIAREARARAEEDERIRLQRAEEDRVHREKLDADEKAAREKREKDDADARARLKADREAQEKADAEVRAKQKAEREALDREQERQREEQRKLDEAKRELERKAAELLDGAAMLQAFVDKYGTRAEFASVVKAIRDYQAAVKKGGK